VPSESIRDAGTAAPWVLVVKNDHAMKQAVTLGLRGEGRTEILQGVEAGDLVILPAAASVTPGERVYARMAP
jgi:HlyD family secretion protein